jgi:transposase
VVIGEPDPRQRCPVHRTALVEAGERSHERLDFRYNRFLRLEVRRPELVCKKCPTGERYTGRLPAFLCKQAPLGDGLLAMAVVVLYFDRLPLDRLRLLLEQLGAPLSGETLLNELDRASERIAPIIDEMLTGADHAEAPLPALVTGTLRDVPGSVEVQTGGGHVIFSFTKGDARKSDAKRVRGPAALLRWRGQGLAGRWGQTRQRLLLALLTDPDRARLGLYAIEQLPPNPPIDPAGLASLRTWLDGALVGFVTPKNRYEHAVTAMEAMWPLLTRPDPAARAHVSDTWAFEHSDGDVHAALRWLSLAESCATLELPLWEYLYGLLRAVATDPDLVASEWTPAAVKGRS